MDVSVVGASEYDNRLHIGVRGGDAEHASRVLARRYPLERIVIETGVEVRPVPLQNGRMSADASN